MSKKKESSSKTKTDKPVYKTPLAQQEIAMMVETSHIKSDSNPRQVYSKEAMNELVESVRIHGILQPLLVTPVNGHFRLIAGQRRLKAAQKAGLKLIPVFVRNIRNEDVLDIQLEENLRRQDLNPMEEALAIKSFIEDKEIPLEELSARLNKSVPFLRSRLKLIQLHPDLQKLLLKGKMTFVQAKILATLTEEAQLDLVKALTKDSIPIDKIPAIQFQEIVERNYTLNLEHAPFDKTQCASCDKKSDTQMDFFAMPEEMTSRCLNPRCFREKCEEQVVKQIEECRATGNRILTDEEFVAMQHERGVTDLGRGKPFNISEEDWQKCLACANMAVYAPEAKELSVQGLSRLCLDKKCHREKTAESGDESETQPENGSQSEQTLVKRLQELRRKWLMDISETLLKNPLYRTALALCSVHPLGDTTELYKKHNLAMDHFTPMNQAVEDILANHTEEAREKIEHMLSDVLFQMVKRTVFNDSTLIALSEMLEENYASRFVINEDFLKVHTIAQLHELAVEIGLDKHLEAPPDNLSDKDKKSWKDWRKAAKKDLINLFLQTGFNLDGIVPKAVANLK